MIDSASSFRKHVLPKKLQRFWRNIEAVEQRMKRQRTPSSSIICVLCGPEGDLGTCMTCVIVAEGAGQLAFEQRQGQERKPQLEQELQRRQGQER